MGRLNVIKTYKLFINGQFPRSESGRSLKVEDGRGRLVAHACRASRKDLRDAVEAAAKAQAGWAGRTAYLRGQILYRMAEMMEGKAAELVDAVAATGATSRRRAQREVAASIDRLIAFAGWTDKFGQELGSHNPVAGPYYNFTIPEPTGVVGIVAPDEPSLLGLVSLIAPPLCAGNAVVALGSQANPIPTSIMGEVAATSDVPAGVINLLTGLREELTKEFAAHRNVNAIHAANLSDDEATTLREGAAENVKRVAVRTLDEDEWYDESACHHPWWVEPFVEMKTVWHPSGI